MTTMEARPGAPTHPTTGGSPADHHGEPWFARLARFSARRRRPVMLVWLAIVLVAAPLALTLTGALSGAGWEAQGSISQKVRDELRRDFPQAGAEAAAVVYHQSTPISQDGAGLAALVSGLKGAPGTVGLVDPRSVPASAGLVSPDGKTAIVPVQLASTKDADLPVSAGKLIKAVDAVDLPKGATANATGEWAVWHDFNHENEQALHRAELVSGLPTIVLLLVAFGTVVAAGMPLLLALAGISFGFGAIHALTSVTPLSVWSMNFSMMIGLAVGIDYALFIVSRYREEREDGKDPSDAIATTLATAGKAVFLSALTVVLSLAAVFLVPVMVFRSMALGMILSVVAVATASLTLLPAVLVALGDKVLVKKGHEDHDRAAEGRWARWTGKALERPKLTLAVGLVALLALAAPALGMRLGMPGAHVVDTGASSRDGYDALVSAFGQGAGAPLFVTAPAADADKIVALATADRDVAAAQVVTQPASTGRVAIRVVPKTAGDSSQTSDLVGRLRSAIAPVSATAAVGGPGSQNHDLTSVLTGKAPLAIGVIMLVAFVLLLAVFRSVGIAVASLVLNLIGVSASFGFATLVFQHGWGLGLLGIHSQGFVDAWAPLFFFALLFGLSMDYQLFLLAAIKERRDATGDARLAVREGIARTGRPITNAALIMIVVFVAFGVTGPIPPTELGVTLALAVLLDATVIRMMLVPSLLGLLGEKAWWMPAWLDRRLPHIRFSH